MVNIINSLVQTLVLYTMQKKKKKIKRKNRKKIKALPFYIVYTKVNI